MFPARPSPAAGARLNRWRDAALIALLAIAAVANFAALRHYVYEDAYITFRYAASLAAGDGLVFQPGERVLGTSTPLFTLLLALLGALGADIPAAGTAVSTLALSACAFFGWRLLARRGAPNAGAVFAVAAVSGASGVFSFSGMETTLHLALIFLAAYLAAEDKPIATGVVLGLICLNRYDGVMVVAAVLLTRLLIRRGRPLREMLPWREALVAGAIFGGWLLFAQLYFGSPLPNTYAAKAADVGFGDYALGALETQGRSLLRPLYRLEPPLHLWPALWQQVTIVLALPLLWRTLAWLAALGRRRAAEDPREDGLDLAPLAFAALFLWLGYSAIGPPLEHTWYLIPVSYCLLALSLAAWARLLKRLPANAAAVAAIALIAANVAVLPWAVRQEAASLTSVAFGYDRIVSYREMAAWVRRHGLADTTVLTFEPGYLTYLSGQKTIDAAGLVSRDIFYHGPQERRSDVFELLEARQPEMAVLGSPVLHEPTLRERRYRPALSAAPGRNLWIRRDFFARQLDRLYAAWRRGDYYQGKPPELSHPFRMDFGRRDSGAAELPFHLRGAEVRPLPGLAAADGSAWDEAVLTTAGRPGPAAGFSEPFLIDFDALVFLFSASHDFLTAAQIYVDGLLVYEIPGRPPGGKLEPIEVPLYGWRGRAGKIYFVSAEGEKGFVAADRIVSKVYARRRVLDDFESGAYDPAAWEKGFGAAPTPTRAVAAAAGLEAVQGSFAASSLGLAGRQEMIGRSFRIDHRWLAFTVLDCGENTRIELRVAGRRHHLYLGKGRDRVDLVQWDLGGLAGQEAVLSLYDDAPEAEKGIGIDSILLYDEENGDIPHP